MSIGKQRAGRTPTAMEVKTAEPKAEPEPKQPVGPRVLYREWIFQTHHPGLRQVLIPSRKDQMGNLIEEQFEADFGGDSGREGMWRMNDMFRTQRVDGNVVTGKELVEIMRTKITMKPVADNNIVELTRDRENGDPVYEPLPEDEP